MKLNQKGWGLQQMLLISGLLLLTLLVVAVYVYSLYNQLDQNSTAQYVALELKLETAAVRYDTSNALTSNYRVSLSTLKQLGYISDFSDNNSKPCDGYVDVNGDDFNAYISCENFISPGYLK